MQQIGIPKLHIFKRSMTIKDLKLKVFQIVRPLLKIPQLQRVNQSGVEMTDY